MIVHCKDVSVKEVDFSLDEETILSQMKTWVSYTRTEFVVLVNGNDRAVVRTEKKSGAGLFRELDDFEIVSLPKDTVFFEDPVLDVLNTPALANIQLKFPGKTVVVRGMFSHINFIKDLKPIKLRVLDNIPPEPSKLGVLVRVALQSGFIDHPIILEDLEISMKDRIKDVKTSSVMFPCRVSGLESKIPFSFLDDAPPEPKDVTLIGCGLSKRIYVSLYNKEPDAFLDVCPPNFAIDDGVKTITKCCKVKNGHKIEGCVATVPWGATVPEVVDAINALFSK